MSAAIRHASLSLAGTRRPAWLLAACVLALLGGCATTPPPTISKLAEIPRFEGAVPRVALMPLDVELAELTAAGLQEPRADWTQSAIGHMGSLIQRELTAISVEGKLYAAPEQESPTIVQLQKLHQAVGETIFLQQLGILQLPSHKGRPPDWSLGANVAQIRQATGCDYALYVFVRDSYATGGRVGMAVALAVLGVAVPMGQQAGFASLVDLKTGDIVWFNRLLSGTGDLRTGEAAASTVKNLLHGFPGMTPTRH